jgi:3-methyl-2-oxobutanoate hydroxymethyltransferase
MQRKSTPARAGTHASTANSVSTRGLYAMPEPDAKAARPARVRVHHLTEAKQQGQRLTAVTCYDATFARLVDAAGIDVVLVGDSLGHVIQGHDSTLPVTVDHIVYHTAAVARGLSRAHLVADLPFMSYRNPDVALQNAGRMLAEGGAHAVKLEGGAEVAPTVRALVQAGIPVMGHIGLTPQSVHAMGGHRVQGRGRAARQRLLTDAKALQDAGCYAIVLELVPAELAAEVSQAVAIPTIGIGAGAGCDGQILVLYDLLGLNPGFAPKFLKRFANLAEVATEALVAYRAEVDAGSFPGPEHTFTDPTLAPPAKAAGR